MKNPIITAIKTAQAHVATLTATDTGHDTRKLELMKLKKEELVALVLATEKFNTVKIEDIVKPILEDPACAWLDYNTIAELIKSAVPSAKTSHKSIASYASKYPTQKGWDVQKRKTASERQAALLNAAGL